MCMQLNKSDQGPCKCKFPDRCKSRIEFEGAKGMRTTHNNGRDRACPVSTTSTIDVFSNKIYPPPISPIVNDIIFDRIEFILISHNIVMKPQIPSSIAYRRL